MLSGSRAAFSSCRITTAPSATPGPAFGLRLVMMAPGAGSEGESIRPAGWTSAGDQTYPCSGGARVWGSAHPEWDVWRFLGPFLGACFETVGFITRCGCDWVREGNEGWPRYILRTYVVA